MKNSLLTVKIAEGDEIESAYQLRYNVFNEEMKSGIPASGDTRKDKDEFDPFCDHLIVRDEDAGGLVVGTYRILRKDVARQNIGFYSENEFDLSILNNIDSNVAEVGRSCVHKDYRGGSVISLLWQGLASYMRNHDLRYLMGCASVYSTDGESTSKMYSWFREKNAVVEPDMQVIPKNPVPGFSENSDFGDENVSRSVPPIMKGYLRAGAKIGGPPSIDEVFKTTDFFIFFDARDVEKRYGRHFEV